MLLLTRHRRAHWHVASWQIQHARPLYFALMLLLQAGLFGTFTALNFFHWFIFWELGLIPAFFLIKLWGGPRSTGGDPVFRLHDGRQRGLAAGLPRHLPRHRTPSISSNSPRWPAADS